MTKLWSGIVALVCCVLAGFLVQVAERDADVHLVRGGAGQTLAMTDTMRMSVDGISLTTQLRDEGTYIARTRNVFLVIKVTVVSEQSEGGSWDAIVTSGGRTFKSRENIGIPASGFKVSKATVVEMPQDSLRGARLQVFQRGIFKAFENALDFDLGIDDPAKVERVGSQQVDRLPEEEAI